MAEEASEEAAAAAGGTSSPGPAEKWKMGKLIAC